MRLSFLKRGDWRVLQGVIIALASVVLLLTWSTTLQRLHSDKILTLDRARAQQNNLAVIVSENLGQLLDGARTIGIASWQWWEDSPEDVADRLSAMRAANPAFLRISLYDTDAVRVYSSSPAPDEPSTSEIVRDAWQSVSDADFMGLIVPTVSVAPENAWHTPLLFPVGEPGETPVGMLMVMLDLGYLLKVYRNIEFGASGVIHLLTRDAQEVLEWRPEGLMLNSRKRHFGEFLQQPTATGSLTTDLFHDGRIHLSSFSRAERFSFLLVVSRTIEDILAVHHKARSHSLTILGLLTIILVAAAYLMVGSIGRHGRLFGALVSSDKRNRLLIDRLKEEKGRAFMLAAHDHLTGLPNRRTFTEMATSELNDVSRDGGHYALMYLDLDRFKIVNDTLGHHVGDFLLQTVATRLRESLRGSDVVARLGGDEFAILLTSLTSVDELALIAKKIIRKVSQPLRAPEGQEIKIGPSIGIAVFPRDGEDFDTLCRNADAAMYASKRTGRSTYTYYDATLNACSERMFSVGQGLPKAIAQDELVVHFQPKVRLSDFRVVGLEALVRWQHPELGLVYPDDFIPFAEETGLIEELGDWVARSCCRQQAEWRAQGLDCVPVAINISALQLKNEDLPDRIQALLDEYDLAPAMIAIEITETVLLDSLEAASKVLRRLEALGVQISLDDFGSGFSSLGYVRSLPIHIIKIDKQFIRDIRNKPHDAVLTASIISLAHNLGKEVVAEGVETLDQLIYLKTAGCDMAQGYHFSRPVPAERAAELLQRGQITPQQTTP